MEPPTVEPPVNFAALFSKNIYGEQNELEALPRSFSLIHHETGDPSSGRTTTWSAYSSEELGFLYLVFRGSVNLFDWMTNV
jgi:hypothetical protein